MSSTTPAPERPLPRAVADRKSAWSGLDQSSIMGVEMMGGILLWSLVGFGLDRWLGTTPWLFAVGAMLGFAAGLYLIYVRAVALDEVETAARAARDGGPRGR